MIYLTGLYGWKEYQEPRHKWQEARLGALPQVAADLGQQRGVPLLGGEVGSSELGQFAEDGPHAGLLQAADGARNFTLGSKSKCRLLDGCLKGRGIIH